MNNHLLACESCWTHSIPLGDMEGVDDLECPACGCSILIVGMFDGMDLTRWGGGSNTCWEQNVKDEAEETTGE